MVCVQRACVRHRGAVPRWGFRGATSVVGDAPHPAPGMADDKLPSLPHRDGGSRWLAEYARQRHSSAKRSLRRQESALTEKSSEPVRATPPRLAAAPAPPHKPVPLCPQDSLAPSKNPVPTPILPPPG